MQRTYKILCKSWVAWCNSSLVFFAQVMVFVIAKVPKFKSYFWKTKITLTFFGWPWLGLRNLECSCWKAAELLQLQLSWTSADLSFLNSSWTSTSTGVQAGSTGVQGKFNRGPERFNRFPGKVQLGFFPRTSLVKTGWTGPRGGSTGVRVTWPVWPPDGWTGPRCGSTGVRTCFCSLTCNLPVWLADWLSVCPRRLNRSSTAKISPTTSFEAPPIYTHSYFSPHTRARPKLHF